MPETDAVFGYSVEERVRCIDPLAGAIRRRLRAGETTVVGIQGGQGTGKTTLAAYLAGTLRRDGLRTVCFSLDDFYTTREERVRLAARHPDNPFYRLPRGMPGTHRTDDLYAALLRLRDGGNVDLPVFDKSAQGGRGDVADQVVPVRTRQDVVIFEGWFVGTPECGADELIALCRRRGLEAANGILDPAHLAAVLSHVPPYQRIWRLVDFLVMLCPDSLSFHERWRLEQEHDLIARTGVGMSDDQVRDMVRHFLPLTCLGYEKVRPDVRVKIDSRHRFCGCSGESP